VKALRQHLWVVATIAFFFVLSAAIAAYILDHQRFRWPWEEVMTLEVEFSSGQAVSPGQGQQVLIAGVKVGEIGGVRVEEGRALVRLDLEPDEVGPLYRNATFLLRPKTALNDMSVQVDPGRPDPSRPDRGRLDSGDRVPVANTQVNVNPDEVFATLDADVRDYFTIFASAAGEGTRGRGEQLRRVLKAGQPTFARLSRVTGALADRRRKLRHLVHNLRLLAEATAEKDEELAELVDTSAATFRALGERESDLQATVERLPGALRASRGALHDARRLAVEAGPALEALRPAARELGPSLEAARPLLGEATPIVRRELTPLVRQATPLLRELRPSLRDLNSATPNLVRTGRVLNYLANELGYNPPGPEEGYLFWTAWFAHNADSIFSIEDAHGAVWRGLVMGSCSSLQGFYSLVLPPAVSAPLLSLPSCP
jgi:phospholipid/cholesterol/gamma-HCH transport system substrate-binding protein